LKTGWTRIFGQPSRQYQLRRAAADDRLRFTLDYEADARFFAAVIERLGVRSLVASDQDRRSGLAGRSLLLERGIARVLVNFHRLQKQEAASNERAR